MAPDAELPFPEVMETKTEQLRHLSAADTGTVGIAFGVGESRATQLIETGAAVGFGNALAIVGTETSRLIGTTTRDVFAVTPGLLADAERWDSFERSLAALQPANRLRLHGRFGTEVLERLGFAHILFFVEKMAAPTEESFPDLAFRPVENELDIAFVRQCAARSVYQGMTAAYPGTPITAERMVDYLDAELAFSTGEARGLIAWLRDYPVAHATWVERGHPVTGERFVEMWDVDGLLDLHRSGILSKVATRAESWIATAGGSLRMQGTVTIEPGWERTWASLEGQGWERTHELWAKYPWDPTQVVIDLAVLEPTELMF